MAVRVAINGFGRIGRLVLRSLAENKRKDIVVVGINDLGSPEANAHLLKHDSVHGTFPGAVSVKGDVMKIGSSSIKVMAERDPTKLPWKALDVDVVMECTGIFTKRDKAAVHLDSGAKRVLVSAPCENADATIVYGINHGSLKKEHRVVSNASCTTNCLAPVADVLHKTVGIKQGFMTTIHAFTGDQNTVDTLHKDLRRARAASLSMIPTSTGAAKAIGLVLPELKGRLDGTSVRVPTPNVSMIDLTFISEKPASAEAINKAMIKASKGYLKGIMDVTEEKLVSIDFNHCPASATFDLTQTQVIGENFVRILAWYDNEWGFSTRMADTTICLSKLK